MIVASDAKWNGIVTTSGEQLGRLLFPSSLACHIWCEMLSVWWKRWVLSSPWTERAQFFLIYVGVVGLHRYELRDLLTGETECMRLNVVDLVRDVGRCIKFAVVGVSSSMELTTEPNNNTVILLPDISPTKHQQYLLHVTLVTHLTYILKQNNVDLLIQIRGRYCWIKNTWITT